MNIWFFNHYAVPPAFYPLTRTYNFAKVLLKGVHTVKIFAASTVHKSDINLIKDGAKYKEDTVDGIEYVFLKTSTYKTNGLDRIVNMIQYTLGLFTVTKGFARPDIIVASSVHPLACIAGIKIAKTYKCKCVIEIADLWPQTLIDFGMIRKNGLIAKVLYALEHWLYKHADEIIFTMEGGKDYVLETFGMHKPDVLSKIHYINNGIDSTAFTTQRIENQYADRGLDNKDDFKVVYTGSLGEANAVHYIVEAAHILEKEGYTNIKFFLFGSGYKKPELEEYCSRNNIKNVVFKGSVDKKYIPNILSKSNLAIVTGKPVNVYKYGLSLNKLFDYMAAGKPTLSNIVCGYDNLVKFQCGITVKGGDADSLARGIIRFFAMPRHEYEAYCQNALLAAECFDFKNLTKKLADIILKHEVSKTEPEPELLMTTDEESGHERFFCTRE